MLDDFFSKLGSSQDPELQKRFQEFILKEELSKIITSIPMFRELKDKVENLTSKVHNLIDRVDKMEKASKDAYTRLSAKTEKFDTLFKGKPDDSGESKPRRQKTKEPKPLS